MFEGRVDFLEKMSYRIVILIQGRRGIRGSGIDCIWHICCFGFSKNKVGVEENLSTSRSWHPTERFYQ
jgi:hypothetical protein